MVTPEELESIAAFASLDAAQRRDVCRVAADVSLARGEYAAYEGDERALFAVLEGRLEVVRATDGIDRVLGERATGDIFGEIPMVLGAPFLASFRAAAKTRVMRIGPQDYHALVATATGLAVEIGRLANYRLSGARGVQSIVADTPPARAVVLGHRWDASCAELRRFLDRNQITFEWVTPDDVDAAKDWGSELLAEADLPAIRVVNGKTVARPSMRRVAELLDLETEPALSEYDTVIVGAGPAGLAAAVYGASEGLRTIVVEREAPGGQAGTSSRIENYLGFPSGVSGDELASRALRQARRLGAEILVTRTITRIDTATREVYLDGGDVLRGRTTILACGVSWRQLSIQGFDRLAGRGVFYGAARSEAAGVHGLDVHIIGAGNSAGQAALFFATHARSVTILCRGDSLDKSMSSYLVDQVSDTQNVDVMFGAEVTGVDGEARLEAIDVRQSASGSVSRLESGGLFVFIGADAETSWLPPDITLDQKGYVLTGTEMRSTDRWPLERDPYLLETSVPGIFACGDVRFSPVKRVAAAVGEGSMAIAFVHQYLRDGMREQTRAG